VRSTPEVYYEMPRLPSRLRKLQAYLLLSNTDIGLKQPQVLVRGEPQAADECPSRIRGLGGAPGDTKVCLTLGWNYGYRAEPCKRSRNRRLWGR
jgi:hypothetical protein